MAQKIKMRKNKKTFKMMEENQTEVILQNTAKDLKMHLHKSLKLNKKMISTLNFHNLLSKSM